jgi:hypothetical protein
MCCAAETAAMNTVRMAQTYGCNGAQGTIVEHRALHSESVESLRRRHIPRRSDSPDANQASAGC